MCGIIGIVGKEPVAWRLVDGLRRMEYRGYDSAGVCTVHYGELVRRRAEGKLNNLVKELTDNPASGQIGIAHTRWATHGAPTTNNAHPHATGEVALVHNGIIENFKSLREELLIEGAPVTLTVVHPGGIKTDICNNATVAEGQDQAAFADFFNKHLARTSAASAARTILHGVKKNHGRILIGPDAVALDLLVRVTGSGYQRLMSFVDGQQSRFL